MGVTTFAQMSNGESHTQDEDVKLDRRIKREQRNLARKQKGSNNRLKSTIKLKSLYNKKTNKGNDFKHKLTNSIAKNYDLV